MERVKKTIDDLGVSYEADAFIRWAATGGNGGPPRATITPAPPGRVYRTKTPRHVLVVEDSLDGVHSLVLLLRDMGHVVDYAINGYAALDVVKRLKPEFVFLDLRLPGINGFEVCKRIKASAELKGTRVIAITAFDQSEYAAQAKIVGCEQVLIKPVSPDVFEELLG